ncbi:MAG: sugar ABC transporter permease, partial [Blautia sp.]|nr:sugar ABC transporter permease [Blautia sp.]
MSEKGKKKKKLQKSDIALLVMLLPGSIYLLVNNYAPMFGMFIAFKKINYQKGIFGSDWVGLSNFEFLFR